MRQSLVISRGELSIFVTRPIAACMLAAALIVVLAVALGRARMLTQSRRERVTAPN